MRGPGKRDPEPDHDGGDSQEKRTKLVQMMVSEVQADIDHDREEVYQSWKQAVDGWSTADVLDGDRAELAGLLDRGVLLLPEPLNIGPNAKIIDTKMVRRQKGDRVKSRLVLRDFRTGPPESEMFASTPSG